MAKGEYGREGLNVTLLGSWPYWPIQGPELRQVLGQDFLGADIIIGYTQQAVSQSVSFGSPLEKQILDDIKEIGLDEFRKKLFDKHASSALRGHSVEGLAGVMLGIKGPKTLIDSGLTGNVMSRSLVTSSRRAKILEENIIVPEILEIKYNEDLKQQFMAVSKEAVNVYDRIVAKFSKEIAAKAVAYNDPGDLLHVMPMSAILTLAYELEHQQNDGNGTVYLPLGTEELLEILEQEIIPDVDMSILYQSRKASPRPSYLHWNIFKAPQDNLATEIAEQLDNPLIPRIANCKVTRVTKGFLQGLDNLEAKFKETYALTDPHEIEAEARDNMLALMAFVQEYKDNVSVQISNSRSWRVWSELKRHGTLDQHVESVYMAADRAYEVIKKKWSEIENLHTNYNPENSSSKTALQELTASLEPAFVIPPELKFHGSLLLDYLWICSKQHMFRKFLLERGIPEREAITIVPRSTRVRTLETYDLSQIMEFYMHLRLCHTCEPEMRATTELIEQEMKKHLSERVPGIEKLIGPKCILGFCLEPKHCAEMYNFNRDYTQELHSAIRKVSKNRALLGIEQQGHQDTHDQSHQGPGSFSFE